MALGREIKKHMLLLDNKIKQSNKHLEFITGDARVAIARYQGTWKAAATLAMLLPAPWIPGPVVRSAINWIFTENASEAFNFHRSFLPGIVLKAAYGDNVPEWANAIFENGLNAPATVVGTDGMVYRVDGNFPADYKNAGKASFKYIQLDAGQSKSYSGTTTLNDPTVASGSFKVTLPSGTGESGSPSHTPGLGGTLNVTGSSVLGSRNGTTETTLKIPSLTVSDQRFPGSMAVQLENGDPEIDKMIIIDAVELQVLNAVKMLRGIDTASNESAAAALQGLCLKVIGDCLLKYYTVRWLSEQNAERYYPSALANLVRSVSYPVEHEGAIQYRYGMYHQSLSDAGRPEGFNRANLSKAQRPADIPEAVWNRAGSEWFDSDYKRLLKNVKHNAVADYATRLMADNAHHGADNKQLAANLLCFKAYCYAYGIYVGESLASIVQGGTLQDTNSDTSSWGTKNVFARYAYPALRNSFKVLTSAVTWRTASADTHARLLFPLAMYVSMLEMRFGTYNTAVLQYEAIDDNQQNWYKANPRVNQRDVQLAQAPVPQNGQQGVAQFFNANQHAPLALQAAFASEFAAMNSTIRIHEPTGRVPLMQQVNIGDNENPNYVDQPTGQYELLFDVVEYDTGLYDATLLGILDCMLSSAYFVYQTIGWDYSVTKLWGGDQYLDWGLFNDPMLIGYITLRKKFIRNYDDIIRKHCAYLKEQLKDGWTTSGNSWWAPTPRTWRVVGAFSQALSQPGTWLGKSLDNMCAWLTDPGTAHGWDFQNYGQDAGNLQPSGDAALDPAAQHSFSNFVAQHLDLYSGTRSHTNTWGKVIQQQQGLGGTPSITANHALSNADDIEAACAVLNTYLKNGGNQKKVLEMILKMLPKLA